MNLIDMENIFREYLPEDVLIVPLALKEYVDDALENPFIQAQIDVGIYDKDNIYTDFLSFARSFPFHNELHFCPGLIRKLAEGVDDDLTADWLRFTAIHEAHHFEARNNPTNAAEHADNELACIQAIADAHPDLQARANQFEEVSKPYQRVMARVERIKMERSMS